MSTVGWHALTSGKAWQVERHSSEKLRRFPRPEPRKHTAADLLLVRSDRFLLASDLTALAGSSDLCASVCICG